MAEMDENVPPKTLTIALTKSKNFERNSKVTDFVLALVVLIYSVLKIRVDRFLSHNFFN